MLQKNGLKGVFINGSSGEGYMLTTEERMLLAERWVAVAPKDFKIIVHVGAAASVRAVVWLSTHRSWVFGVSVQWLLHSHISAASRNW